jgi:hypothetical protein
VATLNRFGLVSKIPNGTVEIATHLARDLNYHELVWRAVSAEESIQLVVQMLRRRPTLPGSVIGDSIRTHFSQHWSPASDTRIGNALRIWAQWVITCEDAENALEPKIRRRDNSSARQGSFFE